MSKFSRVAIIGTGPSAIYVLKHLLDNVDQFRPQLTDVFLFDKRETLGVGMPYDRTTTDKFNMCNISSAEIPQLDCSLVEWLHSLSDVELLRQGIDRIDIDEDETYCRTTLGDYFHHQIDSIIAACRLSGVNVHEHPGCPVTDVVDRQSSDGVVVHFGASQSVDVDRVVIATGHSFEEPDEPSAGYFASPWPMQKLIPAEGHFHNFTIGTLGASLSAFDVVSSLAHRHGSFIRGADGKLRYQPRPGTERFRIVLHSSQGWLPHLQYEQEEPFREIYRHVDRDTMLSLRDKNGFLSLDDYFDRVARPALRIAFEKDGRSDLSKMLLASEFSLENFVTKMSDEHTSEDPFSLMRAEMPEAKRSLRKGIPIHWKEVLDDLMFTLNFHFDQLAAEDHLRYRHVIVPFLMNVIAAMPLSSARILLALNEAEKLDLLAGRVSIKNKSEGRTTVSIESDAGTISREYQMFVDCSGQGSLELEDYPFPSMTKSGTASVALARFRDASSVECLEAAEHERVIERDGESLLNLGGIAIDGYYRVIGSDGCPNDRIYDVAFPHATGVRPYSYGLQACDATASIVIQSWCQSATENQSPATDVESVTRVYENVRDPSQDVIKPNHAPKPQFSSVSSQAAP